jgi:hypothetical protein
MNPKNALFLSASLTAFVLAVLFGVVTKVTNTPTVAEAAPIAQAAVIQPTVAATDAPTQEALASATAQGPLGPEEAAALAAKAISRQDVYSVETFSYKGADSYKVVFSSGDIVYIGMDRTVLEMGKLPVVVANVDPAATSAPKKHKGSNNNQQPNPTTPPTTGGGEDGGGGHDD